MKVIPRKIHRVVGEQFLFTQLNILFVLGYHPEAVCVIFGNSQIFLSLPAEIERYANRSLHRQNQRFTLSE